MGRMIIFTGKGGVGKTCMSVSHALTSAREGRDTLLVSTDMAHSIGRILGIKIGSSIVSVEDHLDALEIDADEVMHTEFADITSYIGDLLAPSGMHFEYSQELEEALGLQDLFSLLKIEQLYKEGRYERIIVDCAPTGETLSLLKLPELLSWYIDKMLPVAKAALRVLSPVSERMFDVKLPDADAVDDIDKLCARFRSLDSLLKDEDTTSVRLVCTPEKMVVEETKRNYMYLNLYDFNVDGLYINRVLPDKTGSPFMDEWYKLQQKYINQLYEVFPDIPAIMIPWYPKEVCGIGAIGQLCAENLDVEDLFDVRTRKRRERYTACDNGYCLSLPVKGADCGNLDIRLQGTDLMIKLNDFIRCIPLPDTLRHCVIGSVDTDEDEIRIFFIKEEAGQP